MSDDIDVEESPRTAGDVAKLIFVRPFTWMLSKATSAISSVFINGIFALLPTVFSGVVWILKPIFIVLNYLFTKIIPFLVMYVGVPLFILGAIMAFMFLGGHILWVVIFLLGIFFYIKGLYNIKFVKKAEEVETETHSENTLKYK